MDVETNPIAVVKLFALGRGAYYEVAGTSEIGDGALRASTPVRFGYEQAALSRLSPGTTFYVADTPLGTVHAVRIPSGSREIDVTALDTVTIEWTLVRAQAAAGCPARWTVAKARPLPETATTTDITWIF